MIYPAFLKKGDTIGICAPSSGVGHKIDQLEISNEVLRQRGYLIKETASVRNDAVRSTGARKRAAELDQLILDEEVDLIMCAAGGDFMMEMMPHVDFDDIAGHPKWLCGMSDPTNLLFTVTTMLDIATLYGKNGAGFTFEKRRDQRTFLEYMEGDIKPQKSYGRYQTKIDSLNGEKVFHKVRWISRSDQRIQGRAIGGCLDVIAKLIGTKYDYTLDFIERYADDGIVWYFDIFAMSSYDVYMTLLQFKDAGWFRHCRGVLFSRVAFPRIEEKNLDYVKAADKALGRIPHICEMDIGHTEPFMTMINGALIDVRCRDGAGRISFRLG